MVRCTKYLQIVEEDNIVDHINELSPSLYTMMDELASEFPELVSNQRGRGLFAAFDLPTAEVRNNVLKSIWKNGALILPCGWKSIRFRPPLNISKDEIKQAGEIIKKSMHEVKKAG
jgi:L-lysine 6-transaminase